MAEFGERLAKTARKAVACPEVGLDDAMTVLALPEKYRKRLRTPLTTNSTHQHTIILPALDIPLIDPHERIFRFQPLFVEGSHPNVQSSIQTADGRFREARAAQFFRDRQHLPHRHALHDHLIRAKTNDCSLITSSGLSLPGPVADARCCAGDRPFPIPADPHPHHRVRSPLAIIVMKM